MTTAYSEEIEALVEEFDELVAEDQLDEARAHIDRALSKHTGNLHLLASKAELEIEDDRFDAAVALLIHALGQLKAPEAGEEADEAYDGELHARLLGLQGYAQFHANNLDESRRAFNRALKMDPDNWSYIVGRAQAHEKMGFHVATMLDLDHAISIDDQEGEPFAIRARLFMQRGQVEQAYRDFAFAIEGNPYDELSRLMLARLYALQGQTADAMETLELLVDEGEEVDYVVPGALLRSQLSLGLGSTEAAADDAERAIELLPKAPWGYLQLAACFLTAMDGGKAIEALKRGEDAVGSKEFLAIPDTRALRAAAYEQLEKYEKAKKERKRVEGAPRLPAVVYGPMLNPAQNAPINPDNPIDIQAILTDLFGDPRRAPEGYEQALRQIIARIPSIIEENPEAEQLQIELPPAEGMIDGPRNLMIQVNRPGAQAEDDAELALIEGDGDVVDADYDEDEDENA